MYRDVSYLDVEVFHSLLRGWILKTCSISDNAAQHACIEDAKEFIYADML